MDCGQPESTLEISQPLAIFVLELVSSGFFGDSIGPSFRQEGRAMLDAVLDDFRRIPEVTVETILDDLPELRRAYNRRADVVLCIAPEFDDLLRRFCEFIHRPWMRTLNCESSAISLCADKWWFMQHLQDAGIPTIPSGRLAIDGSEQPDLFPCVVKPRFGAGSWLIRTCRTPADWPTVHDEYQQAGLVDALYQPLIPGAACSIAALLRPGCPLDILPIAVQQLSDDGRFRYLGGALPAPLSPRIAERIRRVFEKTIRSCDGLNGYIGCDLIVPDVDPDHPVIVELNPRLTTSYIGYRTLCVDNLMERLVFPALAKQPLRWRTGTAWFDGTGTCRFEGGK